MSFDWTKIKNILSLNKKQLFIVAFISWSIVLLPSKVFHILEISVLREQLGSFIGILALISTLWLISIAIYDKNSLRESRNSQIKKLKELTPDEQYYLSQFVKNNSSTHEFSITDGIAMGLKNKGLLSIASNISRFDTYFDFNIKAWALEYLKKHPDLLEESEKITPPNPRGRRFEW